MKLGVLFPQTEIGTDPVAIRDYVQAAEDLGYHHVLVYDHVLGASPEGRGAQWVGPYTNKDMFHEVFVLFGYLAGVTRRLELVTCILTLPQRQTALVAKQAAEVDVLAGGRLRLGVGVGWNSVECEAMGQDFHTRGRRIEEQIAVLRALWTREIVTFEGRWHHISALGLNPMPIQRPIPIWMGGESDVVIRRVARIADGWFPGGGIQTPFLRHPPRPEGWGPAIDRMRALARAAGRDPRSIGIEGSVSIARGTSETWVKAVEDWRTLGATHLRINTMGAGLSPEAHIETIRRFKDTVPGSVGSELRAPQNDLPGSGVGS